MPKSNDSAVSMAHDVETLSTEEKPRAVHVQHLRGQVGSAHLYREDSEGHVVERVLIPQPTNDPRDPLTWSKWRKHMAFLSISFFVFLSNYVTASITPGYILVVKEFRISLTKASYLLTFNILFLGIGNLFWIPLSLKYGKRPISIISSAIFFASCIWAAEAKSYGSLLGARMVQGFGASSSEAMGPAMVADLYFLHERGTKIGAYTFMIASGSALGGLFAGLVVNATHGWRFTFWMNAILTGTSFLLITLFQPETNFLRSSESETGQGVPLTDSNKIKTKYIFRHNLGVTSWYDRETPLFQHFARPVRVLAYPAVTWCYLTYGICLGWVVLQQTANASAFPILYHFTPLDLGNINVGNLIGSVIGCLVGGPLSDYVVRTLTKKYRHGLFAPETRLLTFAIPFLFGPVGLLLWGGGLGHHLHWSIPVAGASITYAVLCAAPSIGITYVVDCYRPVAGEVLTGLTAVKNGVAFGISFGVQGWIEGSGYFKVSRYMTLIEGVVFSTTVLMYFYGERLRGWTLRACGDAE